MYDAKSEPNEFVGDDRAEAAAKACSFYGLEESELRIVEPEIGEIFGGGGRTVLVAVPVNAARSPRSSDSGGRRPDRERSDRGRDGGRERGERGRDGGRDRGDRGRDGGRRRERPSRPESVEGSESRPVEAASAEESKGTATGKIGSVGEFLLGAIERMRLGAFEISEQADGDYLVFQLVGPAASALAAGDGRGVDALQLLANQAAMRGSDDAPRIVVDAEGNAERREVSLGRLAERAAKRALDTSRSVALDPMNGRDRRILHITVREMEGVATMSVGEGRYRQVVVVPEGSPEYEEASKSSEDADSADDR